MGRAVEPAEEWVKEHMHEKKGMPTKTQVGDGKKAIFRLGVTKRVVKSVVR